MEVEGRCGLVCYVLPTNDEQSVAGRMKLKTPEGGGLPIDCLRSASDIEA
jgi:hypothetical protein